MTPFGRQVREMRRRKGVTLKAMAAELNLSAAYLSALEHGRRGKPSPGLVMQILGYFGVIWDDAEELKRLARLSQPKVTIDTGGLSPTATELANQLRERIATLPEERLRRLLELLVN
ncbi:MAG TPA: helix-turn-helix domain-containing protein [Rhodospirillaceae bacterium]|nr:helix-turn-helix domain-containing protein [Rhodospirillaceae bacterium]